MARSVRRTLIVGHCGGSEKFDKRRCARQRRNQVRRQEQVACLDVDTEFPVFPSDGSHQFLKDGKSWWGDVATLTTWRRRSRLHVTVQAEEPFLAQALRK